MSKNKFLSNDRHIMAGQTIGFLDSYDILGKAIPGIVLLFGLVLLLPKSSFSTAETTINIKNLAAIFVASAVAGVVFGEGVHTLARMGERLLAWIKRRLTAITRFSYELSTYLQKKTDDFIQNTDIVVIDRPTYDVPFIGLIINIFAHQFEFTQEAAIEELRPKDVNQRFQHGLVRSFSKFGDAFVPHRTLFNRYLSEHATFTRGEGPNDMRFKLFSEAVTEYYRLPASSFRDADNIYPLISSHLDSSSVSRSRRFQGRYSFTRGMWLSTAMLAVVYFGLYSSRYADGIESGISSAFSGHPHQIFQWVVIILISFVLLISLSSLCQWIGELDESGKSGVLIPWTGGFIFTSVLGLVLDDQILYTVSFFWSATGSFANHMFSVGELVYQVLEYFMWSENIGDILIIEIFHRGLLGLVSLLAISSLAFIIATGSYKRHYVEYTLVDTWESLKGKASAGLSLKVDQDTLEGLDEMLENHSRRNIPSSTQRLRGNREIGREKFRDD